MRQRERRSGGEIPDFVAAIIGPALEFIGVKILFLDQTRHGVRQLDFVSSARALFGQQVEDARLQDIAAGDPQQRRRRFTRRFLDHAAHF